MCGKMHALNLPSQSAALAMVLLWPDGSAVPESENDLLRAVLEHAGLRSAADSFLGNGTAPVPASQRSLNIMQGEEANVDLYVCPNLVLGSEDATTCVIMVLLDMDTHTAWAAHYDEGTCQDTSVLQARNSAHAHCMCDP